MSNQNYTVGYKRPPKNTQFKPGQSGNPNGRPKDCKNLSTDLREEMYQTVSVNEGGAHLVISKQRAMLKALFAKAVKGDTRAIHLLINLILGVEESYQANGDESTENLKKEDQAILEAFIQRVQTNPPETGAKK